MKQLAPFFLFFFILLLSPSILLAQPPGEGFECYAEPETGPPLLGPNASSTYGRQFTPRGTFRMLLVFAGFEGFEGVAGNNNFPLTGWDNEISPDFQLPEYVDFSNGATTSSAFIFNQAGDFNDPNIINDPDNQRSVSLTLNKMSKPNADFKMIADVFTDAGGNPVLVTIDPSQPGLNSWGGIHRAILDKMTSLNPDPAYWSQFDQRQNTPNFQFDNSINPQPDGVIDYIVFVHRFSKNWSIEPIPGINNWSGSSGGLNSSNIDASSNTYLGLEVNDGFSVSGGGPVPDEVFIHELGHAIFWAPHCMGSNGVTGNKFIKPSTGLGTTAYPGVFLPMLNSWERWYLGYINPIEVAANGNYLLQDFYETGDAIRIPIPHSGGQNLWIQNHTGIGHNHDQHRWAGLNIGPGNINLGQSDPGVYMFIEDITSSHQDYGYSAIFSGGANGFKMINASGHWDFLLDSSAPPASNNWNHDMSLFEPALPNPISGLSPWHSYRGDLNNDGIISVSNNANTAGGGNEGEPIRREKINAQEDFLYRTMGLGATSGNLRTPGFVSGDELSVSTNPMILNYPSTSNGELDAYFLNGLKVEIVAVDPISGAATINVQFQHGALENDVRWCGNIVLPDITGNNSTDLLVMPNKQIHLTQGLTATQKNLDSISNEFVPPTVFKVSSGAKLHLQELSKIIIDKNATLRIEPGAELILEEGAEIEVLENGILDLGSTDITLNGNNALINVKGILRTSDNVDFTFSGPGYVKFHASHLMDLGQNSHFKLDGEGKDHRFIEINDDTQVEINNGGNLDLRNGKVLYHSNSSIVLNTGKLNLISVTLEGYGYEWGLVGVMGDNIETCNVRFSKINNLLTGIQLKSVASYSIFLLNNFTFCGRAVVGEDLDWIGINSNDFSDNSFSSVALTDVHTLSGYRNEILSTYGDGFTLNNVNFAYLNNGKITNCTNGIRATESNIFLSHGITIENCSENGVLSENLQADKVLSVGRCLCANIINNGTGVAGTNVILDIDAYTHQFECNLEAPLPNRFDGNTKIFDICYPDPNFDGNVPILMRYNYWGGQGLYSYDYDIIHGNNECPPWPYAGVPVDDTDYITDSGDLADCSIIVYEPSPDPPTSLDLATAIDCTTPIDGISYDVHEQVRDGWQAVQDSNMVAALAFYTPVAGLRSDPSSYSSSCTQKIDFSYAMTNALSMPGARPVNDFGQWTIENRSAWNHLNNNNFILSPNPATDEVYLYGSERLNNASVRIYDQFGRFIFQEAYVPGIKLDLSSVSAGLYVIHVIDPNGQSLGVEKLIIR